MACIFSPRKQKPSPEHIAVAKEILKYYGGPSNFSQKSGWNRNYIHGWVRGHWFLPFDRAEYIQSFSEGRWSVIDIRPDLKVLQKYFERA